MTERLDKLERKAPRETVAPRDTKVYVDPQAIKELRELEDHSDQLVLKETRYVHMYIPLEGIYYSI